MRIEELVQKRLRRQISAWLAREPEVRRSADAEELHRLRRAGQRFDAALRLFEDYVPAGLQRFQPEFKPLLRSLGAVRDLDIRLQAIGRFRRGLTAAESRAVEPLLRLTQTEHARLRAQMLRAMQDVGPADRMRRWQHSLGQLSAHSSSEHAPAVAVVPALIQARHRKLRKAARRLGAHSTQTQYHAVRARVKKLRYAVESAIPLYGRTAEKFLRALRKAQRALGEQHDAYLVRQALLTLVRRPARGFSSATVSLVNRIAEQQTAVAIDAREAFHEAHRKLHGKRWKRLRRAMAAA